MFNNGDKENTKIGRSIEERIYTLEHKVDGILDSLIRVHNILIQKELDNLGIYEDNELSKYFIDGRL